MAPVVLPLYHQTPVLLPTTRPLWSSLSNTRSLWFPPLPPDPCGPPSLPPDSHGSPSLSSNKYLFMMPRPNVMHNTCIEGKLKSSSTPWINPFTLCHDKNRWDWRKGLCWLTVWAHSPSGRRQHGGRNLSWGAQRWRLGLSSCLLHPGLDSSSWGGATQTHGGVLSLSRISLETTSSTVSLIQSSTPQVDNKDLLLDYIILQKPERILLFLLSVVSQN